MFTRFCYGLLFGYPMGYTFCDYLWSIAQVEGRSMQPTFNPDPTRRDFILLYKFDKYNVSRGDIVIIISPKDPNIKLVKRVVGLEGEILPKMGKRTSSVKIPTGHIWIEGDHTDQSIDSNSFGPVPLGLLDAKVMWIIWPFDRIRSVSKNYNTQS